MFNRTTSTKFFMPRGSRIKIRNPNIEIRNNFKISILNIQNLPMRTSPTFLNVLKLVFWVFPFCFEFRISSFEFVILFILGVLCVFAARPVEYPFRRSVIFSFTALFHGASPWNSDSTGVELCARSAIPQGEISLFRFCNRNFNWKFHNIFA